MSQVWDTIGKELIIFSIAFAIAIVYLAFYYLCLDWKKRRKGNEK